MALPRKPAPASCIHQCGRRAGFCLHRVSGRRHIGFEPFDSAVIVGVGENPVEDAISCFSYVGPAQRAACEMVSSDLAVFYTSFLIRLRAFVARIRTI